MQNLYIEYLNVFSFRKKLNFFAVFYGNFPNFCIKIKSNLHAFKFIYLKYIKLDYIMVLCMYIKKCITLISLDCLISCLLGGTFG